MGVNGGADADDEGSAHDAERDGGDDVVVWQPATSRPGELFTFEGQMRAYTEFGRGLHNDDPRLRPYRRSMHRIVWLLLGLVVVILVVGIAVSEAFGWGPEPDPPETTLVVEPNPSALVGPVAP